MEAYEDMIREQQPAHITTLVKGKLYLIYYRGSKRNVVKSVLGKLNWLQFNPDDPNSSWFGVILLDPQTLTPTGKTKNFTDIRATTIFEIPGVTLEVDDSDDSVDSVDSGDTDDDPIGEENSLRTATATTATTAPTTPFVPMDVGGKRRRTRNKRKSVRRKSVRRKSVRRKSVRRKSVRRR
jgi:hypothetical protein